MKLDVKNYYSIECDGKNQFFILISNLWKQKHTVTFRLLKIRFCLSKNTFGLVVSKSMRVLLENIGSGIKFDFDILKIRSLLGSKIKKSYTSIALLKNNLNYEFISKQIFFSDVFVQIWYCSSTLRKKMLSNSNKPALKWSHTCENYFQIM